MVWVDHGWYGLKADVVKRVWGGPGKGSMEGDTMGRISFGSGVQRALVVRTVVQISTHIIIELALGLTCFCSLMSEWMDGEMDMDV